MQQESKLIGYHEGNSFIHRLNGASKLLFFFVVTIAIMTTYDIRMLIVLSLFALLVI